jgi:hypothetical protein
MRRAVPISIASLVLVALLLASPGATAATGVDDDYAGFDVVVTDTKGVTTECQAFGYFAAPNVLLSHRGDGELDVPFRLIRTIVIGEFGHARGRAPCSVTLRSGKVVDLEIDAVEEQKLLGGQTEMGEFRIRMEKVRRLDLLRPTGAGAS